MAKFTIKEVQFLVRSFADRFNYAKSVLTDDSHLEVKVPNFDLNYMGLVQASDGIKEIEDIFNKASKDTYIYICLIEVNLLDGGYLTFEIYKD